MNSKAIKRQLLAAIAMVLVAAIALGSSTYAWFVASGTVEAKGMSVQAQSEGNLVIRYNTDMWSTVATAIPSTAVSLLPASTNNLSNWVYSTAKESHEHNSAGTYTDLVEEGEVVVKTDNNSDSGKKDYVMIRKFEVRSATKEANDLAKGLFVDEIKVTYGTEATPSKALSSALRVGVQCGDTSLIFAPVSGAEYGAFTDEDNSPTGVHVFETQGESKQLVEREVTLSEVGSQDGSPKNTLYAESVPNAASGLPVYIYIWYEGEDIHLFSDNFEVEQLNVSVKLTSISSIDADYKTPSETQSA